MRYLYLLTILLVGCGENKVMSLSDDSDYIQVNQLRSNGTDYTLENYAGTLTVVRENLYTFTQSVPGCTVKSFIHPYATIYGTYINIGIAEKSVCVPANCSGSATLRDSSGVTSSYPVTCGAPLYGYRVTQGDSTGDLDLHFVDGTMTDELSIYFDER